MFYQVVAVWFALLDLLLLPLLLLLLRHFAATFSAGRSLFLFVIGFVEERFLIKNWGLY
jgi:hypothetical protein